MFEIERQHKKNVCLIKLEAAHARIKKTKSVQQCSSMEVPENCGKCSSYRTPTNFLVVACGTGSGEY